MNRRDFLKATGIGVASLGAVTFLSEYFFDGYSRLTDLVKTTEIEQFIEEIYGVNVIGNPHLYALANLLTLLHETSMHWDMFDDHMKYANSVLINSPIYHGNVAVARTNIFTDTIILNYYKPSFVVHELAHLLHKNLKDESFNEQWKSLTNLEYYQEMNYRLERNFWTRHNLYEDVAHLTQSVFWAKMDHIDYNFEDNRQGLHMLTIMRESSNPDSLKKKCQLLNENRFFSGEEYSVALEYL